MTAMQPDTNQPSPSTRRPSASARLALLLPAALWLAINATPAAQAAQADRSKPIEVSANKKVTDYKKGTSIYTGNVVIDQGSLHATGDKATLYIKKGNLVRAVLEGKPATFQERDDKGKLVKGRADTADYLASEQKVILKGNAFVSRDGDELDSQQITYDMKGEVVTAGGKSGGNRVHMVIQPQSKQRTATTPDKAASTKKTQDKKTQDKQP